VAKDYTGQASADMVSSAGDALLSVADPSPIWAWQPPVQDFTAANADVGDEAQFVVAGRAFQQPGRDKMDSPRGYECNELSAVFDWDELRKLHTSLRRDGPKLAPSVANPMPALAGALVFERVDRSASGIVGVSEPGLLWPGGQRFAKSARAREVAKVIQRQRGPPPCALARRDGD
jgi:hypothetical protein